MSLRVLLAACAIAVGAAAAPTSGDGSCSPGRTYVALSHGYGPVSLEGAFERREDLWPDTALVYRDVATRMGGRDGRDLLVLDSVLEAPRTVHEDRHKTWASMLAPTWSVDAKSYYVWLDIEIELAALDVETGEHRRLSSLGSHIWNYKGDRHLDPRLVPRRLGVIEAVDANALIFLTSEETNDAVAPWQRRRERGGYQLVAIDLDSGMQAPLGEKRSMGGPISSWDYSVTRRILFVRGTQRASDFPELVQGWVETRRPDGTLIERILTPASCPERIELDPTERWLLVERYLPDEERIARSSGGGVIWTSAGGGFFLLDLGSGEIREGPARGARAALSPTGEHVVYIGDRGVHLWQASTGVDIRLVQQRHPVKLGSPSWWTPVWSRDTSRLALMFGGGVGKRGILVLDLITREYVVAPDVTASQLTLSPVARPFGG